MELGKVKKRDVDVGGSSTAVPSRAFCFGSCVVTVVVVDHSCSGSRSPGKLKYDRAEDNGVEPCFNNSRGGLGAWWGYQEWPDSPEWPVHAVLRVLCSTQLCQFVVSMALRKKKKGLKCPWYKHRHRAASLPA